MATGFNASLADAQATAVIPVKPTAFDFDRYEAYAASLDERIRQTADWFRANGLL